MRLLTVCLLLVLSILVIPALSGQYSAQAGRLVQGSITSEECTCGVAAPPVCYDEFTWQVCSLPDGGKRAQAPPEKTKGDKTIPIGMVIVTFLLLAKRLF